jgi:hypothetical protein
LVATNEGSESDAPSVQQKPVGKRKKVVTSDSSDDEMSGEEEVGEEKVQGKGKGKVASAPQKPLTKCHKPSVFSEEEEEEEYRARGIEEIVEIDVDGNEKRGSRRPVKTQQELDEEDLGEYSLE